MRLAPTIPARAIALAAFLLVGCAAGPTQADIERALGSQLSSAAGDWMGTSSDGSLSLSFRLAEGASGQLTGSGTMTERGAATSPAITMTGSYQRPVLALALENLVYDGRAVRGTFRGSYTSVGGISDTLVLTGTGYTRRLGMLLQERAP